VVKTSINRTILEMGETDRFDLDTILVDDHKVLPSEKVRGKTSKFLTRYEYAAVIYTRANQLRAGSNPYIDTCGEYEPIRIAEMELAARVIPLIIKRRLPNGKVEILKVRDMNIRDF